MDVIKRKISLDSYINRTGSNLGQLTATTFNINIFFTQDADDMGVGTEIPFIEKNNTPAVYTDLLTKLNSNGYKFEFMNGTTTNIPYTSNYPSSRNPNRLINQYYINGIPVTGLTEDKLDEVSSYDANIKYTPGFDISKSINYDYLGIEYDNGVRVITNDNLKPIRYLIDGDTDQSAIDDLPNIKRGVYYITTTGQTRTITNTSIGNYQIPYTEMYFNSEGFNATNVHLSATTKEEYLFGITSSPTVFNDLFIDRGRATVIQSHMQLGEIKNMSELMNYGNGFYKIQR
jgi:hypothetical protein